MNTNQDPAWALEFDTPDLIEAVTIVAIQLSSWARRMEKIEQNMDGRGMRHLRPFGADRYIEVAGPLPMPKVAFAGRVQDMRCVAALAVGIRRPAGPLLRIAFDLCNVGGDEHDGTIGDIAEFLVAWIDGHLEEHFAGESAASARVDDAPEPFAPPENPYAYGRAVADRVPDPVDTIDFDPFDLERRLRRAVQVMTEGLSKELRESVEDGAVRGLQHRMQERGVLPW
ncbi:MAG: hypothetical protein VYD57_13435 [Pseudomonadota bacterium]|nr:hypothetical protein [Pseudomonadota bacterium]